MPYYPSDSIELDKLPTDLAAAFSIATRIAEVVNNFAECPEEWPDPPRRYVVTFLEGLEIRGDVRALLTANALELNARRNQPVEYWGIVQPNAHLVALAVWDRLLAMLWFLAGDLNLARGENCIDRFNFDVFKISVFRGHERALCARLSKMDLPRADTLFLVDPIHWARNRHFLVSVLASRWAVAGW